MSRNATVRYRLSGSLIAETPLHVGGFGDDPDTDLPLARDGQDRYLVPGTGLAGALRQWCAHAYPDVLDKLWGFQEGDNGHASFVVVEDAALPNTAITHEIRDGVGIDRENGVAAEHVKYDRAVLPRGATLPFTIVADVNRDSEDETLALLAGLRSALEQSTIRLGAAKSRGLGRIKLVGAALTEQRLNRKSVFDILKRTPPAEVAHTEVQRVQDLHRQKPRPRLDIAIKWRPLGRVMVKAGFEGIAADMLPLVSGSIGGVAPVIPGSSIKGPLRQRAEQIVCTLLGIEPCPKEKVGARKSFLNDVIVPLVEHLFGSSGRPDAVKGQNPKQRGQFRHGPPGLEGRLGLSALGVDDCYGTKPVSADHWQRIAGAKDDAGMNDALNQAGLGDWQEAVHVAIDRWTGGAAESFLYTILEPHIVPWDPIRLSVDLTRFSKEMEPLRQPALALLLLVLRDLALGRLPLGFAVNRGMGAFAVDEIELTPHDVGQETSPFTRRMILWDGKTFCPDAAIRNALTKAWGDWLSIKEEANQ